MLLAEYENYSIGTSFAELTEYAYESWSKTAKSAASIWLYGVSADYCRQIAKWDYTPEYKLSLVQEKMLKEAIARKASVIEENKIAEIRNKLKVSSRRNVAYAYGKINGEEVYLESVSGRNTPFFIY